MEKQQGFGLSDMLISLLLSSLIMSALINQYVHAKQNYQYTRTAIEKAFELQLVTNLMRDRVRRAGFTPCQGIHHLTTLDMRTHQGNIPAFDIGEGQQSFLKINRMSEYFDTVLYQLSPTQLLATNNWALKRSQPVLIADCYHAEVQTVKHVRQTDEGQIITLALPLAFIYQESSYIGEWIEERFYLHAESAAKSSLYYQRQHPDELTADIHTMGVQAKQQQGRILLQLELGLGQNKFLQIDSMVRAV